MPIPELTVRQRYERNRTWKTVLVRPNERMGAGVSRDDGASTPKVLQDRQGASDVA